MANANKNVRKMIYPPIVASDQKILKNCSEISKMEIMEETKSISDKQIVNGDFYDYSHDAENLYHNDNDEEDDVDDSDDGNLPTSRLMRKKQNHSKIVEKRQPQPLLYIQHKNHENVDENGFNFNMNDMSIAASLTPISTHYNNKSNLAKLKWWNEPTTTMLNVNGGKLQSTDAKPIQQTVSVTNDSNVIELIDNNDDDRKECLPMPNYKVHLKAKQHNICDQHSESLQHPDHHNHQYGQHQHHGAIYHYGQHQYQQRNNSTTSVQCDKEMHGNSSFHTTQYQEPQNITSIPSNGHSIDQQFTINIGQSEYDINRHKMIECNNLFSIEEDNDPLRQDSKMLLNGK